MDRAATTTARASSSSDAWITRAGRAAGGLQLHPRHARGLPASACPAPAPTRRCSTVGRRVVRRQRRQARRRPASSEKMPMHGLRHNSICAAPCPRFLLVLLRSPARKRRRRKKRPRQQKGRRPKRRGGPQCQKDRQKRPCDRINGRPCPQGSARMNKKGSKCSDKRECVAMLLAGGQGSPSVRPDPKPGKTRSSFRRQVSHHRLSRCQTASIPALIRWAS